MGLCHNCRTDDARATKTECPACYAWRRSKGTPRPEEAVLENNRRRFEREISRNRRLP